MNPKILSIVNQLSNDELLERVKSLAEREREATASLIGHLAELDARRLYLAEGYSSLFTYCTQVLRLSESAAFRRIEAARTIRKFPVILDLLEQGLVNLTIVRLIAAHLTQENHREVLEAARLKSKRQVEELIARLHPQPPVPSIVRKLPTTDRASLVRSVESDEQFNLRPTGNGQEETIKDVPSLAFTPSRDRPATIVPLAPERYKVQFTASPETYKKLRLAQDLLRHQIPDGDPAAIFDRALTVLLEDLTRKKLAATDRPRESRDRVPGSRHIPAEVKRAVWLRDGGRCAFVGQNGRRCTEQGFLEYHHVTPYASGGPPTVDNIQLRCRAHNGYEAELDFGPRNLSAVREDRASYLNPDRTAAISVGRGICCNSFRSELGLNGLSVLELRHLLFDILCYPSYTTTEVESDDGARHPRADGERECGSRPDPPIPGLSAGRVAFPPRPEFGWYRGRKPLVPATRGFCFYDNMARDR